MKIKHQFVTVFVLFAAVALSFGSPIENEAFLILTERFNVLHSKMDKLVNQLEDEKILRGNLQSQNAEFEKKINQLTTESTKQNELLLTKIDLLVGKNVQQDEEILQLKNKITQDAVDIIMQSNPRSSSHNDKKTIINHDEDDYSSPRLPPSSCRQLSTIGHYLDGIYLVANPDTNNIETVYCDFSSSTLSETLYGRVDVKTKSVHFFVQRNDNFTPEDAVVTFDSQLLNEGDAMNLATGVFTVPVNGIYYFDFKGIKVSDPTDLRVFLQVNGVNIGEAYATSLQNYFAISGIGASLRLKTGDQVRLFKTTGTIHDNANHFTFFTGWLVEENLILSA